MMFLKGGIQMKIKKKYIVNMLLILFCLFFSVSVFAVDFEVKTETNAILPQEELKVKIKLLDEKGVRLKKSRNLMIRVSRGGLLEHKYLDSGLVVKDGMAEFTYLAPEKLGKAEILLIDKETNDSINKSIFVVNKDQLQEEYRQKSATVSEFDGKVLVRQNGSNNWDTVRTGQKLYKGDYIKTWQNSWAVLTLFDGSEITLKPSTEFKINELKSSRDESNIKKGIFELIKGAVVNKVKDFSGRGSRFRIETESSVAGVRGTYFEVEYMNGKSSVRVYEGSVRTEHKDAERVYVVNSGEDIKMGDDITGPNGKIKNVEIKKHKISEKQKKIKEEIMKGKKPKNNNGNNSMKKENPGNNNNKGKGNKPDKGENNKTNNGKGNKPNKAENNKENNGKGNDPDKGENNNANNGIDNPPANDNQSSNNSNNNLDNISIISKIIFKYL